MTIDTLQQMALISTINVEESTPPLLKAVLQFFSIISFSHGWAHELPFDAHCLLPHDPLSHYLGYIGIPAIIFVVYLLWY